MTKLIVIAMALTVMASAEWITVCDEDGECKQVFIIEK